MNSCKNFF